jgi:two-component SAPR family response regulator
MKTILVDDEFWSIEQFKIECENVNGINVIGYFDNPLEAIEFCKNNPVEVAMLDIEMPEINGIELAKRLREIHPQIVIVFVTAYDNYLHESIKIPADYYLLKPYTKEDIQNVIDRAILLTRRQDKRVRVTTFGQFDVFIDGKPAKFNGKKVKELFALLVDKNGHPLNTEEAFSYLWEGEEYNNASASKYRKLWARLQEFLQENNLEDLVYVDKGEKSLNTDLVECDYFSFLNGDASAIKKFTFAYMSDYWWSEYTLADLTDMKYAYDEKE